MAVLFLKFGFPSLFLTWFLLFPLEKYLYQLRVFDIPNARSSHTSRTVRGGGIVLVLVIFAGLIFELCYRFTLKSVFTPFIISSLLIAAVSLIDDFNSLTAGKRLSIQSAAALIVIVGCGYFHVISIPGLPEINLGWLGFPLTFLWIVGLSNAYNFMDGIDGIAGGQGVIAGLGWAYWGWLAHQPEVSTLGILIAGTSTGFLGHNWAPARVFLGDVGSVFLGFSFAVMPLLVNPETLPESSSKLPFMAILLVWPFFFDSSFTILRRLRRGENILISHRSHLYQRLVISGYSHPRVATLYIAFAFLTALLALAWFFNLPGSTAAVVLLIPLLSLALKRFVNRRENLKAKNSD